MKITIIKTTHQKSGGSIYEEAVAEALLKDFEVEFLRFGAKSKLKYIEIPFILWQLFKSSKRNESDIMIRNFDASLFLNKKPVKNIAIIHHIINDSRGHILLRIVYMFLEKIIFYNLKKFDAIITVSKYWETYLKKENYKNVHTIYNSFDINEFNFSFEEIKEFKERYGFTEKPIIYIGNCQRGKGAIETYHALRDLDAILVTSGKPQVKIPTINLQVEYRDYLRLLKASSIVVTMSKFKEGWCRTAHEAMLCKTPVIGSGLGGMSELLRGGNQIICKDGRFLKEKVAHLLANPERRKEMGEDGYNFAKNFTTEKFEKEWMKLIKNLSRSSGNK